MRDANGSPPETHLVIGATGVVGWALMQAIADAGHDAIGTVTREPAPGNIVLDIHSSARRSPTSSTWPPPPATPSSGTRRTR